MLSREDILSLDDLPREVVHIEEWHGDIYVRGLTGTERDHFESELLLLPKRKRFENLRAKLVVLAACNAEGLPLFLLNDVERLGKRSAMSLDKIFAVIQRLSGMTSNADIPPPEIPQPQQKKRSQRKARASKGSSYAQS